MPKKCPLAAVLTFIAGLSCAASAPAGVILTPAGLDPGDQFRIIFVSSERRSGASSEVADYDQFVTALATAAGLDTYFDAPVTWEALVSTPDVSAISRLPATSPAIYRIDGVLVASSGTDLWDGSLANPIRVTESGETVLIQPTVWTGTFPEGTISGLPLGNGVSSRALTGDSSRTIGGFWIRLDSLDQTLNNRVYGYSSVLTVPLQVSTVPEPASLTLVCLSFVVFAGTAGIRDRHRDRK